MMRCSRALAYTAIAGGLATLLPRMRKDFDTTGTFRTSTAAAMGCLYAAGAGLYASELRRGEKAPPLRRTVAASAAAAGLGMAGMGMGAFASGTQLIGTETGDLTTGGVYRFSRNPQYVGFVIAGLAGAVARRSAFAAALTAGYAAVCAWWVRIEERNLEREFGADYAAFRAATPRWIGLPHSR